MSTVDLFKYAMNLEDDLNYISEHFYNAGRTFPFRMERSISEQRGYGWHVSGPGVKDHFIAAFPHHNTGETAETVIRLINRINRMKHNIVREALA